MITKKKMNTFMRRKPTPTYIYIYVNNHITMEWWLNQHIYENAGLTNQFIWYNGLQRGVMGYVYIYIYNQLKTIVSG